MAAAALTATATLAVATAVTVTSTASAASTNTTASNPTAALTSTLPTLSTPANPHEYECTLRQCLRPRAVRLLRHAGGVLYASHRVW